MTDNFLFYRSCNIADTYAYPANHSCLAQASVAYGHERASHQGSQPRCANAGRVVLGSAYEVPAFNIMLRAAAWQKDDDDFAPSTAKSTHTGINGMRGKSDVVCVVARPDK